MSDTGEIERWEDNQPEVASPHVLVSGRLQDATPSARKKLVSEVVEKLGLSQFDADTLVNAAADLKQLKNAISQPQVRYVSQHTFRYIEIDVVTWRILPSPENVRFEDRRLGQSEPYRFGALGDSQAVLTMHVPSIKQLLDDLVEFSDEIYRDSPHTKTIATRGIETGGVLSLSRIKADDSAQEFGILESTD
jgi:hypothetical protein